MASTLYTSEGSAKAQTTPLKERAGTLSVGNLVKRIFDICVAFIGLLFLSPFFILIGSFIRRDSPGPVFYKCCRMGKDQKTFMMVKFRTMYEDPSSYAGPCITCAEDGRITPFGRWLRDTKINELPQLWNVLLGDMSLVGPRPEDVDIVKNDWSESDRELILSVRPGITSPASILYRDEEQILTKDNLMEDYLKNILPDKMRLDRLYVQNHGFTSDLDILFWTLVIVIPNMVKTRIPEGYLFAGPISRLLNRYLSWFLIDLLVSIIVVGAVVFFWNLQVTLNWGITYLSRYAVIIALIFSGTNSLLGLNRIVWRSASLFDGLRLAFSCLLVTAGMVIIEYFHARFGWLGLPALPLSMIIITGLVTQIGFITARYRWRLVTAIASSWLAFRQNRMEMGERLLIVGAGEGFDTANWLLRRPEFRFIFHIVGVIDDNNLNYHGMILNGCLILGRIADLPRVVEKQGISVIVFTTIDLPQEVKDYADALKSESTVRLIFLDHVSKMISQQMTVPLHRPVTSLWEGDYHEYLALHDSFTGLPNRTLFHDRLVHSAAISRRYKTRPVVMFVEIDTVHQYEAIGKEQWNEIMQQIIDRFYKFKRESDSIAFLWGGVFAFLLEDVPDEDAVDAIVNRLSAYLSHPIYAGSQVFHLKTVISFHQDIETCMNSGTANHGEVIDRMFSGRNVERVIHD